MCASMRRWGLSADQAGPDTEVLPGYGDWLCQPCVAHAGRGSWIRVDLAPEMFGALVHDGGLVWSSGVPGSLVGVLVVDR